MKLLKNQILEKLYNVGVKLYYPSEWNPSPNPNPYQTQTQIYIIITLTLSSGENKTFIIPLH